MAQMQSRSCLLVLFMFLSFCLSDFRYFPLVFQAPIIPVVFSSYSNFYLRKEKQFKSGELIDDEDAVGRL